MHAGSFSVSGLENLTTPRRYQSFMYKSKSQNKLGHSTVIALHSIKDSSFCLRNFGLKSFYTGTDSLISGRSSVMVLPTLVDIFLFLLFWQKLTDQ